MIGLASDGRLFGLDAQFLFDASVTLVNVLILLFIFIPVVVIIIFLFKYFKQKREYYKTLTDYYNNHINDRQD